MHSLAGQALVLFALFAASFGVVTGMVGGARQSRSLLVWTERAAYSFAAAISIANLVMVRALLTHDFSVKYVAQVGSLKAPTWVTIVSLWSSLEGSILFWGAILGAYVAAFTYRQRDRYREYMAFALGTILFVAAFFTALLAGPANPFVLLPNPPADGPGANPLLQNHLLMVAHPPALYLGYVGMTIPFGIAVAALLRGRLSEAWLKPLRRWTLLPWMFLSFGIILGGWWAYEVLGWGGYWAWDPVENASFLPWLAATGYLHSTVVQERRRILKAWTLSLVLGAFLLTILGTFMTRSGVFNSVHSFTQSPIGPLFLGFLAVLTIGSLALVAGRAHLFDSEGRVEALVSRESAFLVNNLVFIVFTFTVLLGTVFPLVNEAVRDVQISVGEPYFNRMAIPIGLLMVFMMGVGPVLPWGRPRMDTVLRAFAIPGAVALVVAVACLASGLREPLAIASFSLSGFATFVTLRELLAPAFERMQRRNERFLVALMHGLAGNRRRAGGYVVHLAVLVMVVAITASESYKTSAEASLTPGESMQLGSYTLTFRDAQAQQQPHRFSVWALMEVRKEGELIAELRPALNYYETQREPIGTPDVQSVRGEDLYLSLLSFENDGSRVGVRAFKIPLVPWLWYGIPLIALGSLVSLWPRKRKTESTVPGGAQPSGAA